MAFKMSGWSAFTKKDDKNKATVTDEATGKKVDKATGIPVEETEVESTLRPVDDTIKIKPQKVTKVERSEQSKRMEEQRKKMKKQ